MAAAQAQIGRLVEAVGPAQGPMKAAVIGVLGGYLIKAGDPAGGRDLIEQARRAALAVANPEARAFALRGVMRMLSEAGEIDQALALAREATPGAQQAILGEILDGLADDDHTGGWLDFGGINIKIGNPSLLPQGPGQGPRRPAEDRRRGTGVGRCEGAGADAGDRSPTSRPVPAIFPAPWRRPGRSPS